MCGRQLSASVARECAVTPVAWLRKSPHLQRFATRARLCPVRVACALRICESLSGLRIGAWPFTTSHLQARVRCARKGTVMSNLISRVRAFLRNDEGQDLIEYALIAGLIALVATAAMTGAGEQVNGIWQDIETELTNANP